MRITVGLAQIYPKLGDLAYNLTLHQDYARQAREQGVELLVFPELSMTGYQVQDLVPEVALRAAADDPVFGALLDSSAEVDIVVGFVHVDARNRFYIANAYLSGGELIHLHHKLYLPTYAMFDESRYFAQGNSVRAFNTRFGRLGMLICEDFWHVSPAYLLWLDGADILILNSSSPTRGLTESDRSLSTRWVEMANQAYGSMFTAYILHCNRVGYEDGKNFWGGSSVVDPDGEFMTRGLYFDEALITQQIDLNQLHRTRARLPLLRDERPGWCAGSWGGYWKRIWGRGFWATPTAMASTNHPRPPTYHPKPNSRYTPHTSASTNPHSATTKAPPSLWGRVWGGGTIWPFAAIDGYNGSQLYPASLTREKDTHDPAHNPPPQRRPLRRLRQPARQRRPAHPRRPHRCPRRPARPIRRPRHRPRRPRCRPRLHQHAQLGHRIADRGRPQHERYQARRHPRSHGRGHVHGPAQRRDETSSRYHPLHRRHHLRHRMDHPGRVPGIPRAQRRGDQCGFLCRLIDPAHPRRRLRRPPGHR